MEKSLAINRYNKFIERSLEDRLKESTSVKSKYPERVPAILCIGENLNTNDFSKIKYLVPQDLTIGQFIFVIRKRCKLDPHDALFLSVNGTILANVTIIEDIKDKHIGEDGFLYFTINRENTFG